MSALQSGDDEDLGRYRLLRRSLFSDVVEQLRDMIISGALPPGERVLERRLCDSLGVSRTPLREALKVLAAEGLVALLPNRGAMVTGLSLAELDEVVEVMAPLESLIGELAAARAGPEDLAEIERRHTAMVEARGKGELGAYFKFNQAIHVRIIEATGNPSLLAAWMGFNIRIQRYRYMANLDPQRWRRAIAEHEDILAALKAGDGATLGRLLRDHLLNTVENCKQSLPLPVAAAGTGR